MRCCVQEVLGLLEGDPVYWEPGRLKVRLFHEHSKQALAVSERRGVGGGEKGKKEGRGDINDSGCTHTVYRQATTRMGLSTI